ncbi:MAG: bis(5'-nucleosyl)-tetraphosphatase (symmetrical) YqeK [Coriobacteriia bacterium]|nr:bis(5'-nucleosyl)-tetraphosphatase (symmetrical) YqeK [Coriobacteriia bacterium]
MFKDIFDFEGRRIKKNIDAKNPYRDDFYEERLEELKSRVDQKRFTHTMGVIEMSQILAEEYHADIGKARLAALLHDWDKCYTDEEMRKRIYQVGADVQTTPEVIEDMPRTLHGLTAAFGLGIKYPEIPSDVLRAVMVHTTADTHMSALDMIIYIADALDPSRNYPEYDELVELIGKVSLQDLFVKVYGEATVAVIRKGKILHPRTGEIWNYHIKKYYDRHPELCKS